jgi:hypothetical protein
MLSRGKTKDISTCGLVCTYVVTNFPEKRNSFTDMVEVKTLKMEAILSSETLVTTYKTTWCHNPEDPNRHHYSQENLTRSPGTCQNLTRSPGTFQNRSRLLG